MRAFAQAWPDPEFGQWPVGQVPWGHNLVLLTSKKPKPHANESRRKARRAVCLIAEAAESFWQCVRGITLSVAQILLDEEFVMHVGQSMIRARRDRDIRAGEARELLIVGLARSARANRLNKGDRR